MRKTYVWMAVTLVIIGVGYLAVEGCRRAQERAHAERVARELQWARSAVENGQTKPDVSVMVQEAIPMLAADGTCRGNVEALYFSLGDYDYDPNFDYSPIRRLENLRYIFFYCSDSDPVLRAAAGMESIEELAFELCGSSDEGFELLTKFPNLKKVSFQQVMRRDEIDKLEATLPGVELDIPFTEESEAAARAGAARPAH